MQKKSCILIADPENLRLYRSLFCADESLEEYLFREMPGKISDVDADVIILDVGFSPEIGLNLLKELKTRKPHAPVIFLTDVGSESIAVRTFRTGAAEYFRKPVSPVVLKETVQNLLAVKRTARDRRTRAHRPAQDETDPVTVSEIPSCLFPVICHIDNNLMSAITLDQLAGRANMSKYHFCRRFKRHTGLTSKKFILLRRIERAKTLLAGKGDMNVSSVAAEVGFNDVNSFISAFKKVVGVTPNAYKKSLGNQLPPATAGIIDRD